MEFSISRLKIKWKIFIFLLGFCALLLLILWLFQTVFLDFFYRSIKVAELKNNTKTIANNISDENLSDLITNISQNSDVCIEVIVNGESNYSSDVLRECVIHKMSVADKMTFISNARENGGEFSEYIKHPAPPRPTRNNDFDNRLGKMNTPATQSLIYVKLIQDGSNTAILMNTVITPVNATITTLRYQLYFITLLMLLLAALLALIIAKRVSRPIEEINKSAKLLAGGKYDIRFNGKGYLEIGELSDTLNTAASELSKVEALRRELMANISHDLRTPLSLIYSYAEMMRDFPDEITPDQTLIIMEETQRLATLVNDVLDLSKLETGMDELNISRFNITQSIKITTERVAELVKKDGYRIYFDYGEEASVDADEVKIIQVYYNLLINSINYTGDDKTIRVRQIITGGEILIEVSDTGEGINSESLPYIWDRYYKVDKNHKRGVTGTGLGLSIVKRIIERHGGSYGVKTNLGHGSTFWFSLRRGT